MLDQGIGIARKFRRRRLALRLSQRELARRMECSQAYLYQVESGKRPLSPPKARRLESLLGARPGAYTLPVRRGRPPLSAQARQVLRQLRQAYSKARPANTEAAPPRHPRPDRAPAGLNPLWPMALHLGQAAARRVQELEKLRGGDDRFWRRLNSLLFDSWSEKDLVVQVGQACSELVGVSPDSLGCRLRSVCGQTGRDTGKKVYPAFLLQHQDVSLAWFPQRCVRIAKGHRWPDSIVVATRHGRRRTLVVEVDGPEFHRRVGTEERRDRELGVPVLHVHPAVLAQPDGLQRILDWAA